MSQKKPVYVTAEGLRKLQEELMYRKSTLSQQIADEIGQALEEGDLRENAGYAEGQRARFDNNQRISELEDILGRIVVVEQGQGIPSVAGLGVMVELETESGQRLSLTLVGNHETDVFSGKISNESPMGKELMGRKVGDHIEFRGPRGVQVYRLLELRYSS